MSKKKGFKGFIPKFEYQVKPRVVEYKPQDFTIEKFREVFTELFYKQREKDKEDRKVNIHIVGTEEECRKTLKIFDDKLKEEATNFLKR